MVPVVEAGSNVLFHLCTFHFILLFVAWSQYLQMGHAYRIYSVKNRGAYLIFVFFGAALIRGRYLFEMRAFAMQL